MTDGTEPPADQAGPAGLVDVLPAVAAAVGRPIPGHAPALSLPPARSVVVVLVDGLGDVLLARRGGHAPFLRRLRTEDTARTLVCGFPSTTATSMGTIGTGALPGAHGLVGLEVLDPDRDVVFSELAWDPEVDPLQWQPLPTVFEWLAAAGVDVLRTGPGYFDGSGLTEAALRGGRFAAADALSQRVTAAVEGVRRSHRDGLPSVVYLYWGEVDKAGHQHGSDSWEWGEQVSAVDTGVRDLVAGLDRNTLVVITADHGMIDIPFSDRVDVAAEPELAAGVRYVGGEGRANHLYCRPGAGGDVEAAWRARLGDRMEVLVRDEAIAQGWFGPVADRVRPRIGDVVTCATGSVAVADSRTARPESLRLLGMHGARTAEELLVPLLVTWGGRV
jgi:hypothetical protein